MKKGQIANLIDDSLARVLQQISAVCERGLANAYGSDNVARAKWENVGKMCQASRWLRGQPFMAVCLPIGLHPKQNMLPPVKLETVHPSWTLALTSPVTTPPPPTVVPAVRQDDRATNPIAPPQAEPAVDLVVKRNIPTGPANRQRVSHPIIDRRVPAFQPNLPPMQIKRAPWGTKPAEAASSTDPTPVSTPPARPQSSLSAEFSIRNSAARNSSPHAPNTGHVPSRDFGKVSPTVGPSRDSPFPNRLSQSSGDVAFKRKYAEDPVDSRLENAGKTASLASRLGIQVPLPSAGPQNHELDARKKKQRHNQPPRNAQLPQASASLLRPPDQQQKTASHAERPIPSLLARMRDSGTGRKPSTDPLVPPPKMVEPSPRPISPSVSPNPDGIQRRGRGFAAAGIELAGSPVPGFSIRGSTPNSSSRP